MSWEHVKLWEWAEQDGNQSCGVPCSKCPRAQVCSLSESPGLNSCPATSRLYDFRNDLTWYLI